MMPRIRRKEQPMVSDTPNVYAPPRSAVADPTLGPAAGEFELADRGARLGAVIIDSLLLFGALLPAYLAAFRSMAVARGGSVGKLAFWSALAHTGPWLVIGVIVALGIAITNGVLVHRNGQTIAKRWLGIKVVRKDGSRASLARIFWLRNVVNGLFGYIPVVGAIYGLVDALLIFRTDRRCCHDFIADTIVVRA
jgi:uncharacterized RDD family membrane protein YckC